MFKTPLEPRPRLRHLCAHWGHFSAYLKKCLWDSSANQEEVTVSISRLPNAKPKSFVVFGGGYEIAGRKIQ